MTQQNNTKGQKLRVAVVGAGPAGLAACRHLAKDSELFDFVCFEQCSRIGGIWLHDKDNADDVQDQCGFIYDNLRTNLPVETMSYPDFPFITTSPTPFVTHSEVLKYLDAYCQHFQLLRFIKFNRRVESIERVAADEGSGCMQYKVMTVEKTPSDSKSRGFLSVKAAKIIVRCETNQEEDFFDAVMICTGHYFQPKVSGSTFSSFPRLVMHSKFYRNAAQFRTCRKILIVGAGPSGFDIALDIAENSKPKPEVWVACHTAFANAKSSTSKTLTDKITFKSDVSNAALDGNVHFTDGSSEANIDAVILCTGYNYNFPFLSRELSLKLNDQRLTPLYKHLLHINFPNSLCFLGLPTISLPIPMSDLQARYFIALLKKEFQLPPREEMLASAERDYEMRVKELNWPPRYAHRLADLQEQYYNDLSRESGIEPLDKRIHVINERVHELRLLDPVEYKLRPIKFGDADDNQDADVKHSA